MSEINNEHPFFFKYQNKGMLVIVHRAAEQDRSLGVVLCHSYGEEKQYSHNVLTRFARYLGSHDISSVRFDHIGYGDSDGEIEDASVQSHVDETCAIIDLAKTELGVDRIVLVGLRFGATVASLVAESREDVAGIVLWSPIVDGPAFLQTLIRKYQLGALTSREKPKNAEEVSKLFAAGGQISVEGNNLGGNMVQQLKTLRLTTPRSFAGPVLATASETDQGGQDQARELCDAYGASSTMVVSEARDFWDNQSMYIDFTPDNLYQTSYSWMSEQWQLQ